MFSLFPSFRTRVRVLLARRCLSHSAHSTLPSKRDRSLVGCVLICFVSYRFFACTFARHYAEDYGKCLFSSTPPQSRIKLLKLTIVQRLCTVSLPFRSHSYVLFHATTTCIFLARKPNSNPHDPEAALVKFSKKTQEVEPKPLYVNGDYQRFKKKLWNIHIMYRICSTLGCLPWFFSSHRSSSISSWMFSLHP